MPVNGYRISAGLERGPESAAKTHEPMRKGSSLTYRWSDARKDLVAGLTVAAIAVPQAMAYALIAGIDPRFGLYSAVVVTAIASVFGSSSHLINGPTNAISLVVFSALAVVGPETQLEAFEATFLLAAMVGVIQILIAVFKLGDLTRYISESVVLGFMAGAGFLVALTQVGNLFGLEDRGTGHQHILVRLVAHPDQRRIDQPALRRHWLGNGGPGGRLAEVVAQVPSAAGGHAPGPDRGGRLGGHARLVASRRRRQVAGGRRGASPGRVADASRPRDQTLLGAANGRQCLGHRLPRSAGGLGHRQVDRQPDARAAGLQPAVSCRRAGQPRRRFLPVPARLGVAHPLGDQLSGGSGQPLVRRVRGGGGGRGRCPVRAAGPLHPQGGPGGNPPGDRGRVDRLATAAATPCAPRATTPGW